jgi:hypothetical protein
MPYVEGRTSPASPKAPAARRCHPPDVHHRPPSITHTVTYPAP